ncbi:MAG: S46 family peptidase [Brevundimonas sp.]|uniref:S46 family peptidase n=1 Tax=Brevundimonas sp. TaxID=1871086 RepID=UPI0025667382|nr:S46 family peptidase [Brevundimonas sp.]MDK2747751.1 S46 family peptidase [Brevundimonas sp.]
MSLPSLRLTASLAALGAATVVLSAPATSARADEGMWTFDNFPIATVNEKYGTNIDQAWLDRVRNAAVRLQGCSASLVSGEGLILTNHHCVVGCVQDLSSAENDYVKNGWMPATREEEKKCPGQTAEILTDITDVTDRVVGAGAGLEGAAFVQARAAEIDKIQKEVCGDNQKLTCQVISLYRGGQYKLYKFRKYDDVRLVFAPEFQAAFFGGDPDNFNFPRYALDSGFLRIYEDGKPVATPNHLVWNANPPKEGDVTFVAGNPGSTSRLLTMAQLEALRDQQLPLTLIQTSELRGRLLEYSTTGEEAKRVSVDPIFGLENGFKVYYGQQGALTDPTFMATKRAAEQELRQRVAADPALAQRIGDPWAELERVSAAQRDLYLPYRQLESAAGQRSSLYSYAKSIVRAAKERAKPVAERRAGYSDADIASLGRRLATETPISNDLEKIYLDFWLSKTREYLTVDNANVKALLGKESPEQIAARLVDGTRLADPAFRAQALAMTPEQLAASGDPLIAFVMANDDSAQAIRTQWESAVSGPTSRAGEKIAQARFAVYGTNLYPDATFSLRLSYGQVKGWTYRGVTVTPFTEIGGLYERNTGAEPFNAAEDWMAAEGKVNKSTVYDFVSTNDIIGGNSGSPVINAKGEVIGAAFDGNIHSLGGSFGYDGELNRTVTVSTAAITEALRNVYNQPRLLRELGVRR